MPENQHWLAFYISSICFVQHNERMQIWGDLGGEIEGGGEKNSFFLEINFILKKIYILYFILKRKNKFNPKKKL